MEITTRTIDSPLGRWTHAEARFAELAGVVESIWYFDGVVTERRERVFPSGVIEVIVHLGERYRQVEAGEATLCAPVCVTGVQLAPIVIEAPTSRSRVLGIRLRPVGAYALLGRTLAELTGETVDLAEVLGRGGGSRGVAELVERCEGAPTAEASIRVAAEWVAARLARRWEPDPGVAWIAGEIERRSGAVSIGELREQAGFSKNRLAERFREQVGVPPKVYARIRRFHGLLRSLHQSALPAMEGVDCVRGGRNTTSLSQLALTAGYYDQPHMNAEFRELGGMSPREYLRSLRYPGSASLAEPVP